MELKRMLKKLVIMICIVAMILPSISTVALAAMEIERDTEITLGASVLHPSKDVDGNKFGYKIGNRLTYRTYVNDNGTADYSNYIFCLDMNGKFPLEDNTKNGNYISKGEYTTDNSNLTDKTKTEKIIYLLKNANLDDEFETKIAEVYAQRIEEDKDLIPPTTVDTIKNIITDDDLFFAMQLVIWELTNDLDLSDNNAITYTIDGEIFNGQGTYPQKAEMIAVALNYYRNLANQYQAETNTTTNPTIKETTKSTVEEGDYLYVGPYHITSGTNTDFTVTFKNQNDEELSGYTIVDAQNSTGKKVVNVSRALDKDLYIKLPITTDVTKVKMELVVNCDAETRLTYWTSDVANSQPLVSVTTEPKEVKEETEAPVVKKEKIYDLALRKYITNVNGTEITTRIPTITYNNSKERIEYNHKKEPVRVKTGDRVVYTITVYNEGSENGTVTKIRDYLPEGLSYAEDSDINTEYGWIASADGKYATTAYTAAYELEAFDKANMNVSSKSVKIECIVNEDFEEGILTNLAEIVEDNIEDIDSEPGSINIDNVELEDYTGKESNKEDLGDSNYFYEGEQDDDDFEKLKVEPEEVKREIDLALRKYISTVNGVNQERQPVVDATKLADETATTAKYNHPKTPVAVNTGDIVVYSIKVYNEGIEDAYVNEITDYIPEGLGFLINHEINYNNGWRIDEEEPQIVKLSTITDGTKNVSSSDFVTEGEVAEQDVITGKVKIRTELLKYTDGGNENIIPAFDSSKDEPSSVTVQVACIVIAEELEEGTLKNIAAITGQADKDGVEITPEADIRDRDSEPEEIDVEKYPEDTNIQDDDDFENLTLLEKDYDLALKKFISKVNGVDVEPTREPIVNVTKLTQEGIIDAEYTMPKDPVKVKYEDTVVYTIRVYNEGEIDAIAKEVIDNLPEGIEFVEYETNENGEYVSGSKINYEYGWEKFERTTETGWTSGVKTTYLDGKVIKAFDSENKEISYLDLQIEFKVVSKSSKFIIKNIAEITEDDGDDRDSIPNNQATPEDDQDYENIITGRYDLALKKFISKVNEENIEPSREPSVKTDNLVNGGTDAEYTMSKEPVKVQYGDSIIYTIRVYNEGEVDAIVKEVIDNLPEGLEFVEYEKNENGEYVSGSKINYEYGWEKFDRVSENGWTSGIKTTYLDGKVIKAFDSENKEISYIDLQIEFKVVSKTAAIIENIAEITEDDGDDEDSTPDNKKDEEDDQDEEKIIPVVFDLALQKFITSLNDKEITDRTPTVLIKENGEIDYTHVSTPLNVANENVVTYTIRVYNEGNISGYASVIKDDIPEGLVFLPENETNKTYMWKMYREVKENDDLTKVVSIGGKQYIEVATSEEAEIIATDYYSKSNCDLRKEGPIKAYDQKVGITNTNPDFRDVKAAFKVNEDGITQEDRIIINTAEITEDQDKDGKPIDDIDSVPNNDELEEDDIDQEKITVKYFDLSLLKYVSQVRVTEDGKTKITNTGYDGTENPEPVVKVEINRKKLKTTNVVFVYQIKITNEGELEGYAKEITDYIPKGLKFYEEDNEEYGWKKNKNGSISTDYLKDTLLQPGESAIIEVALRWKKSENNLGLKTNIAEISEDDNEYGTPDIDSTPDNQKDGEDDQDEAPVILSISTGGTQVYIILTITILAILSCGIFGIKKYVLS